MSARCRRPRSLSFELTRLLAKLSFKRATLRREGELGLLSFSLELLDVSFEFTIRLLGDAFASRRFGVRRLKLGVLARSILEFPRFLFQIFLERRQRHLSRAHLFHQRPFGALALVHQLGFLFVRLALQRLHLRSKRFRFRLCRRCARLQSVHLSG